MALRDNTRKLLCQAEQEQPSQHRVVKLTLSEDSKWFLQRTYPTSGFQLELLSSCGYPTSAVSDTVWQDSCQIPQLWAADWTISDTPHSLHEGSPTISPITFFTDLLYSDTMEEIQLDDLDLVGKAGKTLLDEYDLVETTGDSDFQTYDDILEGVSTTESLSWDC